MNKDFRANRVLRYLTRLSSAAGLLIFASSVFIATVVSAQSMSRQDRLFIKHGVQFQTWMAEESTGRHYASGKEWSGLNFTAPSWFEEDLFNPEFFNRHPRAQWSTVKAPFADQLKRGPNASEIENGFLNADQLAQLSTLVSIGFGDEEYYSRQVQRWFKEWYAVSKSKYPDVIVYNNQYPNQWSERQLRRYVRDAKPDLLSTDHYHFSRLNTLVVAGGSISKAIFEKLSVHRKIALEGHDGTGNTPLPYGQYLLGYKTGDTQAANGNDANNDPGYVISDSQINAVGYISLAMGMKWLNVFRYEDGSDIFIWRDNNGNITPQYVRYAKLAGAVRNLSPHLSRLQTTDVFVVPGQHLVNGKAVTNPLSNKAQAFNLGRAWKSATDSDPYIIDISATNLVSETNNGLRGDVIIGFFRPVKGIDNTADITMAPVQDKNAHYFMLVNGLTRANGCCVVASNPAYAAQTALGSAELTRQKITLMIDFNGYPVDELKRVNRSTGMVETLALTQVSATQYILDITLEGGEGDLFYWNNAHNTVADKP